MAALGELFAEDAVWHVAGNGVLSGTKQGRDAILSFFGELGARSGGNLKVTVQEIIGGKNHTVALQHNHAENNGKTLDMDGARRPARRAGLCGGSAGRWTNSSPGGVSRSGSYR